MSTLKFLCVALSLALAAPAFAKDASRTRLLTWPNPAKAGEAVLLQAEVDGRGVGPRGKAIFTDGSVVLGSAALSRIGAGQAVLAAGLAHSCAVSAAGGARCWGENYEGELGLGGSVKTDRTSPLDVSGLTSGVAAIAARSKHTCALTSAGAVKCWGSNYAGQIGDGTFKNRRSPVDVVGLSSGVVALAAGILHSCALTSAGAVACWGLLTSEDISVVFAPTPVVIPGLESGVVAITGGDRHNCALTTAGGVLCWGRNYNGQLGVGTNAQPSKKLVVPLGLSSGVVAIAAGADHTCARTSGGAVKCWGRNYYGQIGDGTRSSAYKPVSVPGLSSGVVALTAGYSHSCALTHAGAVMCWGRANQGQLGDGAIGAGAAPRVTPVPVSGLSSGAVAITAGANHSCALTQSGALCWGANESGQLGDGTVTSRATPAPVVRLTPVLRARARLSTRSLAVGTHALQARFPGDASHSPSSASQSQTIVP